MSELVEAQHDPQEPGTRGKGKSADASLWKDAWRSLRTNPWFIVSAFILAVMLVMAIFPQVFTYTNPQECLLERSRQRPSAEHWFGTDIQGCDYYARVIYGARASIAVGVVVAALSVFVSIILGLVAGYFGGWVDTLISRAADMVFAIPYFLGAIVFLNVLETRGIFEVAFVLTIFTWPITMRLMRGAVMAVTHNEYVLAARAMGAGHISIMRRHILPNSLAPILGYSSILVGLMISAEAALTFLGVGLQLPSISWGLQLSNAHGYIQTVPHLLVFPLIFVAITVFAFTVIGDAIRDAIDPKVKK